MGNRITPLIKLISPSRIQNNTDGLQTECLRIQGLSRQISSTVNCCCRQIRPFSFKFKISRRI